MASFSTLRNLDANPYITGRPFEVKTHIPIVGTVGFGILMKGRPKFELSGVLAVIYDFQR